MNDQLVEITFRNNIINAVKVDDDVYVAMRPICQNIGLDWASQYAKLRKCHQKFGCCDITTPSQGGPQLTLCIPLRKLNGWLFSVNTEKVRPDIRDNLIAYQEECFTALYDYFTKGSAVRPTTSTKPTSEEEDAYYVSVLSQHLGEILSAWYNNIEPALLKLESPIAKRLHDRFSESSTLLDKVDRRIRNRLSTGQKPRIN